MNVIHFYTDGACNQARQGGWAIYCEELNFVVCNKKSNTTNNEMELLAIVACLKYIKNTFNTGDFCIYSDSAWCIGAISKNWNINCHVSKVQWCINTLQELKDTGIYIRFEKVKGHNKIFGNELCDYYANLMSNI